VAAIREPWLGTGGVGGHLVVLALWLAIGLAATTHLLRREP
jgi:hypothetical protein